MGVTWENAERANGPALVAWLERRAESQGTRPTSTKGRLPSTKLRLGVEHDNVRRTLSHWRLGESPSFFSVDRVLHRFGLHPSELPDDVWEPVNESRVAA